MCFPLMSFSSFGFRTPAIEDDVQNCLHSFYVIK